MATHWLDERPPLGVDVFARPPAAAPAREGGYVALMEACLVALRGRGGSPVEAPTYRVVVPELWRVSDALALIRSTLAAHPDGGDLAAFLPLIPGQVPDYGLRARAAVASTLLAGMELAREGELAVDQEEAFGRLSFSAATRMAIAQGSAKEG